VTERVAELWARLEREPGGRWMVFASLPPLWLAIAWVDARFLLFVPLAAVAVHGGFRLRDRFRPPRDEDDFVL
jgi:hypothetical protein